MEPTVVHQPADEDSEPQAADDAARAAAAGQVVVGNIPAPRGGMLPRPALLGQLTRSGPESPTILTGRPGTGKTQLAAAYARARQAAGWRLIAWVDAQSRRSVLAGLAAVAQAAGLSDDGAQLGPAEAAAAVRRWLEADGTSCLVVFDDVRDLELIRDFVPGAGAARVLVTAAVASAGEPGTSIPVAEFSAEEALALLDGRTGLADQAEAEAVASELEHLPLALDQAAATIALQHQGYAPYLAELRGIDVGDLTLPGEGEREPGFPAAAARAVPLALSALSAADPLGLAGGVMEVVAMLSPAAVGCALLRAAGQGGALLGGGRRVAESMVDQALQELNARSLLSVGLDKRVVSMHRVVARVILGGLARQGRLERACRAAAATVELSWAASGPEPDRVLAADVAGQVAALLDNAGPHARQAGDDLARTLARFRSVLLTQLAGLGEDAPYAIEVGEPLVADLERLAGFSDPGTVTARAQLAVAYEAAGRLAEAIPLFEQVLAERGQALGPDHPDTARSRSDLARAYRSTGRVADAVPLLEFTLAARERLLGAGDLSTLVPRNNLASAYRATGRLADAIALYEKNVAACDRLLGADHPRTQASRHSLDLARQESAPAGTAGPEPG